jgi:hypothetical protein
VGGDNAEGRSSGRRVPAHPDAADARASACPGDVRWCTILQNKFLQIVQILALFSIHRLCYFCYFMPTRMTTLGTSAASENIYYQMLTSLARIAGRILFDPAPLQFTAEAGRLEAAQRLEPEVIAEAQLL